MEVVVDLVTGKIPEHVKKVRTDEAKQEGEKRGAGVVGNDRGLEVLPAAMAAARARD